MALKSIASIPAWSSTNKVPLSIAGLEKAIEHAEKIDERAHKSGDDQDFEAASVAWGNAALVAHNFGVDWAQSKEDRDKAYELGVALNKVSTARKKEAENIRSERYSARKEKWSSHDTLSSSGAPPMTLNVLDQHGGFTAETTKRHDTLWRPGAVLKKTTQGTLVDYDKRSFFQNNNDVTKAQYRIAGYRYPVLAWFDNKTGRRIA